MEEKKEYDYVNHPSHYNREGEKETWEKMCDIWGKEATSQWCEMTAYKYADRIGDKPNEDVRREAGKIKAYLAKAEEFRKRAKRQQWKSIYNIPSISAEKAMEIAGFSKEEVAKTTYKYYEKLNQKTKGKVIRDLPDLYNYVRVKGYLITNMKKDKAREMYLGLKLPLSIVAKRIFPYVDFSNITFDGANKTKIYGTDGLISFLNIVDRDIVNWEAKARINVLSKKQYGLRTRTIAEMIFSNIDFSECRFHDDIIMADFEQSGITVGRINT